MTVFDAYLASKCMNLSLPRDFNEMSYLYSMFPVLVKYDPKVLHFV